MFPKEGLTDKCLEVCPLEAAIACPTMLALSCCNTPTRRYVRDHKTPRHTTNLERFTPAIITKHKRGKVKSGSTTEMLFHAILVSKKGQKSCVP